MNPECKECGGTGEVVIRLEPRFDVSKMEVHAKEILGPCDCQKAELPRSEK